MVEGQGHMVVMGLVMGPAFSDSNSTCSIVWRGRCQRPGICCGRIRPQEVKKDVESDV